MLKPRQKAAVSCLAASPRRGGGTPKLATLLAQDQAPCGRLPRLDLAVHMAREFQGQFILVFNLVDLAPLAVAAGWSQLVDGRFAPARPGRSFTVATLRSRAFLPPPLL